MVFKECVYYLYEWVTPPLVNVCDDEVSGSHRDCLEWDDQVSSHFSLTDFFLYTTY